MKIMDEYYCTNIEEKEFLKSKGFDYAFVKKIIDTKETTVWKYKKSSELYKTLSEFYK